MGCGASTGATPEAGEKYEEKNLPKIIDNGLEKGVLPAKPGMKGKYDMKALFAQFVRLLCPLALLLPCSCLALAVLLPCSCLACLLTQRSPDLHRTGC